MGSNIIDIQVDVKDASKFFENMYSDQVPFATALLLTRLAKGAQNQIQSQMGDSFTLRSKNRMVKGVRIQAAKKSDFFAGTIHSEVGDIDRFMGIHATGGERKPQKHKTLAVPTKEFQHVIQRTGTGAIVNKQKPKALLREFNATKGMRTAALSINAIFSGRGEKGRFKARGGKLTAPKPFVLSVGSNRSVIAIRKGPSRFPLMYMYDFNSELPLKKRWPFIEVAEVYVIEHVDVEWVRSFNQAAFGIKQ